MLSLLEEPDTEVSEIEEILRYDPGLTANVLKLANAAYFGIPSKIGAQILSHWNLPPGVINAVRWHHDPDSPETSNKQMDIVYLANLLCQTTDTSGEAGGQSVELSPAVIERLGVRLNQFEAISDKIAQWVDELSDALAFN
jgi:HD-like signal output (HDOD) protein